MTHPRHDSTAPGVSVSAIGDVARAGSDDIEGQEHKPRERAHYSAQPECAQVNSEKSGPTITAGISSDITEYPASTNASIRESAHLVCIPYCLPALRILTIDPVITIDIISPS